MPRFWKQLFLLSLLLSGNSTSLYGEVPWHPYAHQAQRLALSQTVTWQRILFYKLHGMGESQGLVDDPQFYLDPAGKSDPERELHATLAQMFAAVESSNPDAHAQCRFPARKNFLEKMLPQLALDLPQVACPRFANWWKDRRYQSMSLVFSSFFPDNPASMFGHIFLRLHRAKAHQQPDLLDDSINFSAFGSADNPILFNLKGVFGGFPGRFSLLPYYVKIQEYNNLESRDLWEYPLQATDSHLKNILLSLWEFGPHHADYYYFDDNCSFVLLMLMETADPSWSFTDKMQLWSTPTSCLKSVLDTPKLTQSSKFRPSALSRYQERYDGMTLAERQIFAEILQLDRSDSLPKIPTVKALDTALDYIDFQEKLGGNSVPQRYASLRDSFLMQRSQIKVAPEVLKRQPEGRNPKLSVPESWLMLSGAAQGRQNFARVSWQPVLHDLIGIDSGFASDMQIQIMPMTISYNEAARTVNVDKFDVLNIISVQPYNRGLQPRSWMLRIGWNRRGLCLDDSGSHCPEAALSMSRGLAFPLWQDPWAPLWAGFISATGGTKLLEAGPSPFLQIGPEMLLHGKLPWSQAYVFRSMLVRRINAEAAADWYGRSEWQTALQLGPRQETRLNLSWEQRLGKQLGSPQTDFQLGLLQYF